MQILPVKGNTFCIDTGINYIPFYKINNKEIIMLDSGWKEGEREIIINVLEENDFTVVAILNSHGHIDHIGNNSFLKSKYNCIIAMPAYEAHICNSIVNIKLFYNNQTLKSLEENCSHMIFNTDVMIDMNQENIILCGIEFKIIHTPGHSPEHICIVTPDYVIYLGDVLMSKEVMKKAKIPYSYIVSEDLKSKEKLYNIKYSKYILAHKGIYDNISELIKANINLYQDRAKEIYEIISDSMLIEDIIKIVINKFNIHIDNIFKFGFIERMIKSFVDYLCETERLGIVMDNDVPKYIKLV